MFHVKHIIKRKLIAKLPLILYNDCVRNKIDKLSRIAIFSAIIIVLQLVATYINFSGFPITLTLIPIIVCAAVYGELMGLLMGLVFGAVVSLMVITGADVSGATMFSTHPIITVLTCLIKGGLAGLFSGIAYKLIKNKKLAIIISAIIAPITNTSILCISLALFFDTPLVIGITTLMGINFLIEFLINVLIAPGLTGIIQRASKRAIN